MRILIINIYSTLNKGDAAIALSQIAAIRKARPDADVIAQSWNPESDSKNLNCPVIGPFFDMVSETHPEWSAMRQRLHTLSILAWTVFASAYCRIVGKLPPGIPERLREPLEDYRKADVIFSVGGNFLYTYAGHNSFSFLKHCHQLRCAQIMGKPVVILAQSLGPVTVPYHRNLIRKIVNKAKSVFVRETISQRFLENLGSRTDHVKLTPDTAFLLPPCSPEEAESALATYGAPSTDPVRVGMTVRDWEFPGSTDASAKTVEFHRTVAMIIDWMVETWGARVILLPQCISPDQDDRKCMASVAKYVKRQDKLVVVNDDIPSPLLKAMCGRLDLFVGTRMHSNIFATAMSTPTFAISYQPKTDGIMAMLQMDEWRIPIDALTFDEATNKLGALWNQRDRVRQHLETRIKEMQEQTQTDISAMLN